MRRIDISVDDAIWRMITLTGISALLMMCITGVTNLMGWNGTEGGGWYASFVSAAIGSFVFQLVSEFRPFRCMWRLLVGTTVESTARVHSKGEITEPQQWLQDNLQPRHYHVDPVGGYRVKFLYRKHATLFKLAWG
jgi:hypothetical protein